MRTIEKTKRGMLVVLTVLLMCMMSTVAVHAVALPDLEKEGSVSVTLTDPTNRKTVAGGNLILYKVGEVYVEGANYSWVLSEDFAKSGADLSDLQSEKLIATLAEYTVTAGVKPIAEAEIDANGKASFEKLGVALYLIRQVQSAPGYQAVMPFLVSVPIKAGGEWVYDVDASPKVEALLTGTPTPTITPTPKGTVTPTPKTTITPRGTVTPRSTITPRATITPRSNVTTAPKSSLPRTGQLWWPVPILAVIGVVFVFVGLRRRSR